jgi:predicted Zn-dependent peptidase
MKPSFPREELDRLKKERLTTLLQWHDEPRTIATVLFRRLLYGPRHPYGTPSIGDEKSIQSLTVNDLKRFHDLHFRPKNAVVVIVGDVAPDVIVAKLERVMAEWKGATTTSMNWQKIEQVSNRKIFLVDKPGAAQTEIRIGRIGVERTTPDYYPIVVMNTMLGGSFTSRLNQNLREQHGYTYGAGSVFDMRPLPGPFFAASAVQTEVTDSALIEFMKELKGVRAPASDEEILRAKNFLALGYAEGFQSVGQIAAQLQEVVQYGLPDSYFNTYVRKTLQVTNDDVLQAARAYVDPDRVVIVLVGDRKKIEKGVRALKLGEIEFLKVEDVLGKPPKL